MADPKKVRFTVTCNTNDDLSGMIQTEDQDENERRIMLDDSGVANVKLPPGTYTFVWAVKMSPIQRHRYGIKAEQTADDGSLVVLRDRPKEQTTSGGEDVGFDDFELSS
jgi:hypothetical protein